MFQQTRYRAKIDAVYPIKNRKNFESYNKCFLGISLENSNFKTEKLEGIVKWVARRFKDCTVLIGDSIHRLNLQSIKQVKPEISLNQAIEIGKEFLDKNRYIFNNYCSGTKFNFLTCNAIQQTYQYADFYKKLDKLARTNIDFYRSLKIFAENYHCKNPKEINDIRMKIKIETSIKYFLEEFSIFACLYQDGHEVMVYPGTFSTLSEIADGLHQDAPDELKQLTVVSLCLKGK